MIDNVLKILQNSFKSLSNIQKVILYLFISLTFLSFIKSSHDVIRFNGVDLRPKITGARAVIQKIDPYNINWHPGMSERLLDPKEGHPPGPSRVTYSPMVLLLFTPISILPYKYARILWWLIEWVLMFSSISLLAITMKNEKNKFIFLSISLFFFCSSYLWRLHLERGQYYIFLVFLISSIIYMINNKNDFFAGCLIGLLSTCRITFFPSIFFFILFKKWKMGIVSLASFFLLITFTSLLMGPNIWPSYLNNIKKWEKVAIESEYAKQFEFKNQYPTHAEGLDFRNFLDRKSFNETVWIRLKNDFGIVYDYKLNRFIIISIAGIFSLLALNLNTLKNQNLILLLIIYAIIFIEYFGPEKHLYTNVLFIPIIGLFFHLRYNSLHLFGLLLSLSIGYTLLPINTPLIPSWGKHIVFFITIVSLILFEISNSRLEKLKTGK